MKYGNGNSEVGRRGGRSIPESQPAGPLPDYILDRSRLATRAPIQFLPDYPAGFGRWGLFLQVAHDCFTLLYGLLFCALLGMVLLSLPLWLLLAALGVVGWR
jgi:hypothetical protein